LNACGHTLGSAIIGSSTALEKLGNCGFVHVFAERSEKERPHHVSHRQAG
jgi:hypothetical protein